MTRLLLATRARDGAGSASQPAHLGTQVLGQYAAGLHNLFGLTRPLFAFSALFRTSAIG